MAAKYPVQTKSKTVGAHKAGQHTLNVTPTVAVKAGAMEEVNHWKGVLGRLKNFRSTVESDWKINLRQFRPKIELDDEGEINIRVNQAFSDSKIMLRGAIAGDPFVYIKPTRVDWEQNADLLQVLVNDAWRTQIRKRAVRKIVLDTILFKKGYGLSHYKIDRLTGQEGTWLTRVSPWNVFVDDGANSIDEAYFWFRRVLLPWKDAVKRWPKAKEYLKPVGLADVRPHEQSHFQTTASDFSGWVSKKALDDLIGRVVVWELHNQLDGTIGSFSETYSMWLDKPRQSPYPRSMGSLLTEMVFNEVPDEQYGIGDLEPVRSQQYEMDRARTEQFIHVRRFRRRYMSQKQNLDEDARRALEDGRDGVVVEMQDIDPTSGFRVIEDAPISQDLYLYAEALRRDRRETLGIAEYERAGMMPGTKTKFETQMIMSGSQIRKNEKSEMVELFIEEVTRKDIAIMQTFYDQPMVIRVAGQEGYQWVQVNPSELTGTHEVEIHVGSMSPKDDQAEFMKGQFLYDKLSQDPMINHVALLDRVLKMWQVPNRYQLIQAPGTQPGQPGTGPRQLMNPAMGQIPQLQEMSRALGGGLKTAP